MFDSRCEIRLLFRNKDICHRAKLITLALVLPLLFMALGKRKNTIFTLARTMWFIFVTTESVLLNFK